jgi:hypothetical protein
MKPMLARTLSVICIAILPAASHAEEATGSPEEASAEQVEHCVSQHDNARQLWLSEQWVAARAAMTDCATARCPLAIGADCRTWLEELNGTLPTLLVLVEHDDKAAAGSRCVELDGHAIELLDPPAPLELVPGPHQLRLVFPGHAAVQRDFSLEKGEKNHIERLQLQAAPTRAPALPSPPVPPPARPIPASTYVLSAAALAAFAGSTALLVSALRERNEARVNCSPTCDPSVRKSIETRLIFSDVSAAAGVALGAWALYTFVRRPSVTGEVRLTGTSVVANRDSLVLSWQGEF